VAKSGGAIWAEGVGGNYGDLMLIGSTFTHNWATVDSTTCDDGGGAVHAVNLASVKVGLANFTANYALNSCGAGLYTRNFASVDVDDSTFARNDAYAGGGIFAGLVSGPQSWDANSFISNQANADGGGVYVSHCAFASTMNVFLANNASNGGGLRVFESAVNYTNTNFTLNSAGVDGGALMVTGHPATGLNTFQNISYTLNAASMTNGGNSLYCTDARAQYLPPPPITDAFCDATCLTDQGICACLSCNTEPSPTPSPTGPQPPPPTPSRSPTPTPTPSGPPTWGIVILVIVIVLVIVGMIGGYVYWRKRKDSGRSKFLNI